MGEVGGFLRINREGFVTRDPAERVKDYGQYFDLQPEDKLRDQGARCMDCGVPFCHQGCPLGNLIPEWNDLVYRGKWREALEALHLTNNFPEFTGRICPAPCESSCVLAINSDPVAIEQIEMAIVERGFDEGWVVAEPPAHETGRRVAVVGSGPAGLASAQELRRLGHGVTVFERDESAGGLLRYGVPDAKLPKDVIDRRLKLLEEEGIEFRCGVDVGVDVTAAELRDEFDAVVVSIGSRVHRDMDAPGRENSGIHFAMDYLYQRNRAVAADAGLPSRKPQSGTEISAKGKRVVVIGGGDTGMDCVSNALREGALDVMLLDVYGELPESGRDEMTPWPLPPKRTATTYALNEGGARHWGTEVTAFEGQDGKLTAVATRGVQGRSSRELTPVEGSEKTVAADLALIAIGFTHPEHGGLVEQLGVTLDSRGNVKAPVFSASTDGVFACGDARIGQSLVVTAIAEGRKCARIVNRHLGGEPTAADRNRLSLRPGRAEQISR
jgi:glutamate synthase (NADPH/NADH) small chain